MVYSTSKGLAAMAVAWPTPRLARVRPSGPGLRRSAARPRRDSQAHSVIRPPGWRVTAGLGL